MFIAQGGWREWQIEKINGDVTNNLGNTFTTYLSLLANLHKCIQFILLHINKPKVKSVQFSILSSHMSDAKKKWAPITFLHLTRQARSLV